MGQHAERMAECAAAYVASVERAALEPHGTAPESLVQVQEVVQARIDLYNCLIGLGWTPPLHMAQEIASDVLLLREPTGAAGG